MKQIGIWIDKREAKIVSLKDGSEHFDTIASNVEDFHPGGGSGSRMKGGPQDVVQDSKYLEREKHQLTGFFSDIMKGVKNADSIVIFGPAEVGIKLNNELSEKDSQLYKKIKSVEKADNMTDNQIKSWVKNYYDIDK